METVMAGTSPPVQQPAKGRDISEGLRHRFPALGHRNKSHILKCIQTTSEKTQFIELNHPLFGSATARTLSRSEVWGSPLFTLLFYIDRDTGSRAGAHTPISDLVQVAAQPPPHPDASGREHTQATAAQLLPIPTVHTLAPQSSLQDQATAATQSQSQSQSQSFRKRGCFPGDQIISGITTWGKTLQQLREWSL